MNFLILWNWQKLEVQPKVDQKNLLERPPLVLMYPILNKDMAANYPMQKV